MHYMVEMKLHTDINGNMHNFILFAPVAQLVAATDF